MFLSCMVAAGCRQNGQLGLPSNPLVGSTRIPPPQTGAVSPNSSYTPVDFNAVQSPGLPASDLIAQVHTGWPQPNDQVPHYPNPPLAATPPNNEIAQASYLDQAAPVVSDSSTIQETALQPLQPQLRGMHVNDLMPVQTNPVPQWQTVPYHAGTAQTYGSAPPDNAASSAAPWNGNQHNGPLVATQPLPQAGGDSWTSAGQATQTEAIAAAPAQAAATRPPSAAQAVPPPTSENLQWRTPTIAR